MFKSFIKYDALSIPPNISVSLISPHINPGLNAPRLMNSFDSHCDSCFVTPYTSWDGFVASSVCLRI